MYYNVFHHSRSAFGRDGSSKNVHVMGGALVSNFVKITLLIPTVMVAARLGVPFSWSRLHQLGGIGFVSCLVTLRLAPEYRPPTLALFAVGDGLDVDESRPSARRVVTGCCCGVRGAGVARVTSRVAIDR